MVTYGGSESIQPASHDSHQPHVYLCIHKATRKCRSLISTAFIRRTSYVQVPGRYAYAGCTSAMIDSTGGSASARTEHMRRGLTDLNCRIVFTTE